MERALFVVPSLESSGVAVVHRGALSNTSGHTSAHIGPYIDSYIDFYIDLEHLGGQLSSGVLAGEDVVHYAISLW